jgi:acylphosphatase
MNLKLHEIVALHYELNGITKQSKDGSSEIISQGLMKQKTNMKTKLYLQRLNAVVSAEFKLYSEAEQELFKKYGEEKDGMITVSKEKWPELQKEKEELLTAEKDIDVVNLWSGEITIDTIGSIETDEIYPVFLKLIDSK